MATARFIHRGDAIDYAPIGDVSAGDVIQQEDLVGVSKLDIKAGTLGSLHVCGVFDFPKNTGAGEDILFGVQLYWDDVNGVAIKVQAADEKPLGKASAPAGEDDETVRVRLSQ